MAIRDSLRRVSVTLFAAGFFVHPLVSVIALVAFLITSQRKRSWTLSRYGPCIIALSLSLTLLVNYQVRHLQGMLGAGLLGLALFLWFTRYDSSDQPYVLTGLAAGTLVASGKALVDITLLNLPRAQGFTFHPNILAAFMLLAVFGCLGGSFATPTRALRILLVCSALIGTLTLTLSGSRGAYIGFAAGLIILSALLWQKQSSRRHKVLWIVSTLVAAGLVSITFLPEDLLQQLLPRIASLANPAEVIDAHGRTRLWRIGLELASRRPLLGHGFGAWQAYADQLEATLLVDRLPNSHNLYIELLIDGGSLLLTTFLFWILSVIAHFYHLARTDHPLASAALAALCGFLVHNVTDVLFYHGQITSVLWIVLGLGVIPRKSTS